MFVGTVASLALALAGLAPGQSDPRIQDGSAPLRGEYDAHTLLLRPRDAATPELLAQLRALAAATGARAVWRDRIFELTLPADADLRATLLRLNRSGLVRYAEPNFLAHACGVPNDPLFPQQWQMDQPSDADMDMVEAWDIAEGSEVVLATVDTGFDYNHPDLANQAWVNPGEIAGNGIDDDGNGWVDDVHGIDPANHDSDPLDDNGHGTFVAGVAAAEADNGIGIAGVARHAKIMGCKFLTSSGSGTLADAITCLGYLVANGARVSNHSYATTSYSQSLYDAFDFAGDAGHLAICPGSNSALDLESTPRYPVCFDLPEILAITASDEYDGITGFADYGRVSIDCMVPGNNIQGTTLGGGYGAASANSFAAPTATGLAALLASAFGATDGQVIKEWILDSVDPLVPLASKCATGGRINGGNAVRRAALSRLASPLWSKNGTRMDSAMGRALASHPDADADGTGDLALGVPADKPGTKKCGSVIVTSGRTGATVRTIAGPNQDLAEFGRALARLGDVDGDAIDDLVIGMPGASGGAGGFRVVSGASGATILESFGAVAGAAEGSTLAAMGDLDGDGGPGGAIGAPGESRVTAHRAIDGGVIWSVVNAAGDELGASLANAGDQDGDGLDDVLVGLPGIATTLVLAGADGSVVRTLFFGPKGRVGATVANVGDVDVDGFDDFAIATDARNRVVRVVAGATGSLLYRIDTPAGAVGERCVITAAPDRDKDRKPDFWMAWEQADVAELHSGATGALLQSVAGAAGTTFGSALLGDVDLDGDAFPDLVVGAMTETAATGSHAGVVHAFRCDPLHLSFTPDVLDEGDDCTLRIEGGETGALCAFVLIDVNGTPMFTPLFVLPLGEFGGFEATDAIPTGTSGTTFTFRAWSLKYARPNLIASNPATLSVN